MTETNTDAIVYATPTNSGSNEVESISRRGSDNIYYDMNGKKYMIIFNHYKFKKTRYFGYQRPKVRTGTMEDVTELTKLFDDLGYKVMVYDDLDYIDILETMKVLTSRDHKSTSCLCFAFLTHGGSGGDIYAADRPYHFREITDMFNCSHPSLVGKPKIIFVQACRGNQLDSGRRLELDGRPIASHIIPTHADVLVQYSSVEEYQSFRVIDGSYFIQDMCDVIGKFYEVLDILHIITLVHATVAFNRLTDTPTNLNTHEKKQMPETRHTLTKFFKF